MGGEHRAGAMLTRGQDDAFWARNLPAALAFLAKKAEEGR